MNGPAQDIRVDLQPKPALGAAAAGKQSADRETMLLQIFQNMPRTKGRRFVNASKEVARTVR